MPEVLPLPDHVRAFIAAPGRFATLATLDVGGAPRQAIVWYRLDPDGLLMINSADGRRWPANMRHDPRVALAIARAGDGYRWVGLDAEVTEIVDDQAIAQADIEDLARRYYADDPAEVDASLARFRVQRRVTFRLRITSVHDHLDG
jgi:PPOX class probable F420-dependent enzyme